MRRDAQSIKRMQPSHKRRLVAAALALVVTGCALMVAAPIIEFLSHPPQRLVEAVAHFHPSAAVQERTTNRWVVELAEGESASDFAARHDYVYVGPLSEALPRMHVFEEPATRRRSGAPSIRDAVDAGSAAWAEQQIERRRYTRTIDVQPPQDPLYAAQWHLDAASVQEAWRLGASGAGVLISIVDDGVAHSHADLSPRYVAAASRDVNARSADPLPRNGDIHGTEAAGVAVAASNNDCGVGAAPLASLAGVRLIGAAASDADEAEGLLYGLSSCGVDVYSCSWGPPDTGAGLEGPGRLTALALERGATTGRSGKGAVYVWAAGNGAQYADRTDYDGYGSSRHVIAVGAVGRHGKNPWYSEPGAALLVVAPSSDGIDSISSCKPSGCTSSFGGTSASAPLVAGIVALVLEQRPELRARDIKWLLAETASPTDAAHASWLTNGSGLRTSDLYGYGVVNASRAVAVARTWTLLADERLVETPLQSENALVAAGATRSFTTAISASLRIEHVELDVDIAVAKRGTLTLTLTSPSGTVTTFMAPHRDTGRDVKWRFTATRFYGEAARGTWTLSLGAAAAGGATLRTWRLRLLGT